MENNQLNSPLHKRRNKGKHIILQSIKVKIEKETGLRLSQLKKLYSEEKLFSIGLQHVTTTKKTICLALNIPLEAGCRYKRTLENEGKLVQSIDEVVCPFTKHLAHFLSTNPKEFERLRKSKSNQLNFFE